MAQAQQEETKRVSCLQESQTSLKEELLHSRVLIPESAPFQMTQISNVCSLVCSALKLSPDRAPQSCHYLCITLSTRPQTHYSSSAWGCQDNPCSIFTLQITLAFSCCHPAPQELLCCFLNTKTVSAKLSFCVWWWLPTGGVRKSADSSSPQHRHARQPKKIHKESNLGHDHNEKTAKAQICRETPLIPKGEIIPEVAAGGAKSQLPINANQPAIKLNQGFRVNIRGQVEFGRLHLASSKHHTIMSIVTVDWSRFVMPLIKFYAKWIQSKTSKSFGCSDWYHRSCAFITS